MKPFRQVIRFSTWLLIAWTSAPVSGQERNPFDVLPSRNPQELQQLLDLDDSRFSSILQENNGERFRSIVSPFDTAGPIIFPVSHGFTGAKQACLVAHTVVACRLYVTDLLAVQRERQDAAAVTNNPFQSR